MVAGAGSGHQGEGGKAAEAEAMLVAAGFKIVAVGTDAQVEGEAMRESARLLQGAQMRGHLYFVCAK